MNWIRLILLPLVILVTGLGVTWTAWNHEREAANKELHTQFASVLRETVSRIEQRMASYEQMLHGVQGLVAATGAIDRSQFRDYVQALNLDANFSGIQAIAVEEWVPAAALPAHLARMERQGLEGGYQIRPAGERSAYAPTVLREPYVGRNRTPFGFDQWSDPVRRSAMEKARDSCMATISGKVQDVLLQAFERRTLTYNPTNPAGFQVPDAELSTKIKKEDWNDYRIVAKGNRLQHYINGVLMSEVIDNETEKAAAKGVLGLQAHVGPAMTVQFKDIMIKELK